MWFALCEADGAFESVLVFRFGGVFVLFELFFETFLDDGDAAFPLLRFGV